MTLGELEQIKNQIKRYNLEDVLKPYIEEAAIRNCKCVDYDVGTAFKYSIRSWLMDLGKQSIQNFLSLDIEPSDFLRKRKDIIVDLELLKSPNYLNDIKLINSADSEEKAELLTLLAHHDSFNLSDRYNHEFSMEKIYNAASIKKAQSLYKVCMEFRNCHSSTYPKRKEYFKSDMEIISSTPDEKLEYLLAVVENPSTYGYHSSNRFNKDAEPISYDGRYHEQDMRLISEAKTKAIAYNLVCLACSAYTTEVLYREDHPFEMELISNAKSDVIAYCLCNCAEDINYARIKSKGKFPPTHKEDMVLISKAKDDKTAELLTELACDKDIWERKEHQLEMNLIFNAKTKTIERILFNIISSKYNKDYYLPLLNSISNAKTDFIAKCLASLNISSGYKSLYLPLLDSISNAKTDIVAECLASLNVYTYCSYAIEKDLNEFSKLIGKAKSDVIAHCLLNIANDNTKTYIKTSESEIHREAMNFIVNAGSEEEAKAIEEESIKSIRNGDSLKEYKAKIKEVKKKNKEYLLKKESCKETESLPKKTLKVPEYEKFNAFLEEDSQYYSYDIDSLLNDVICCCGDDKTKEVDFKVLSIGGKSINNRK